MYAISHGSRTQWSLSRWPFHKRSYSDSDVEDMQICPWQGLSNHKLAPFNFGSPPYIRPLGDRLFVLLLAPDHNRN